MQTVLTLVTTDVRHGSAWIENLGADQETFRRDNRDLSRGEPGAIVYRGRAAPRAHRGRSDPARDLHLLRTGPVETTDATNGPDELRRTETQSTRRHNR